MLYSVAIVDDEEMMRSGMTRLIPWESMGFRIAETFCDGDELMAYLKRGEAPSDEDPSPCRIDVVLTDIRMERVSGLQLAAYLSENYPETMVIITSGYQNFSYAQKAMEYGVRQYLLKPIQPKKVREVFASIKRELDTRANAAAQDRLLVSKYGTLVSRMEQRLIADAARGLLRDRAEFERALSQAGLASDGLAQPGCLIVSVVADSRASDAGSTPDDGKSPFAEVFSEIEAPFSVCCVYSENDWLRVALIERGDSAGSLGTPQAQSAAAHTLADAYFMRAELTPTIYVEKYFASIRDLAIEGCDAWQEPLTACGEERAVSLDPATLKNEFFQAARNDDDAAMREAFTKSCRVNCARSMWDGRFGAMHLLMGLADIMGAQIADSSWGWLPTGVLNRELEARAVLNCISVKMLTDWGINAIERIIGIMNEYKLMRDPVERARRYIGENFKRDISLTEVAEHVFLAPAYFSRLFKEREGETFVDYLTELRIREAARLLCETDICIYDVHECVGYHNLKYFYRRFKQAYNCSPGEYRQRSGR